jgi:diguanylate cyclase (GGDEF)-like protein
MLILLSSAIIIKWPDLIRQINDVKEIRAIVVIMPLMPYIVLALGFVMGWRYANAGIILGTLVLALSYYALNFFQTPGLPREMSMHQSVTDTLPFLLPLNLVLFSALIKRRLFTSIGILTILLLAVQVLVVIIVCQPSNSISLQVSTWIRSLSPLAADKLSGFSRWLAATLAEGSLFNFDGISAAAAAVSGLALVCVLVQFIKSKDIRTSGFFFAIVAAMLGVVFKSSQPAIIFYFMTAGLILVITTIEASFSMAYIDELTGLPGRRSLNEMMLNLGKKYTIAMIDVDRFKKFNDTFGHKTGDQVLKMIASQLGKISGGARAFRYGGEEFTAIFAGKSVKDAVSHAEDFRKAIESRPFVVRDRERHRRDANHRGKTSVLTSNQVKVTVSIGLASPAGLVTAPEMVIKAADKKLYKAKKSGRNRTAY